MCPAIFSYPSLPSASLVPVYSFGENDIFRVKAFAPDSWQHLLQVTSKKLLSFCPCIFWGRGLFSAKSWGLLPLARPITTVGECPCAGKKATISCACNPGPSPDLCPPVSAVGRPIPVPQCPQPTEEQVDHYHTLYMKALEQLFEEHKESCGLPASTRLTFALASPVPTSWPSQPLIPVPEPPTGCHATVPIRASSLTTAS